jgi:hypothetical protein
MQIKFACFAPDLWVDTSDDKCSHSVHVVGSIPELGRWDEEKSIPLTKSCAKADTWECEVDVKVDDPKDVQYKYLIKRNSVLVRWEIIPPPFRSPLTATDTQDTLGKLPLGHPKRGGGKSNWMDRKLVTPRSGSEFRFTIGTDKFHPSVSLREVRLDEERNGELTPLVLGTKIAQARTSVQGTSPPQPPQSFSSLVLTLFVIRFAHRRKTCPSTLV